jgi:hypothetical protein
VQAKTALPTLLSQDSKGAKTTTWAPGETVPALPEAGALPDTTVLPSSEQAPGPVLEKLQVMAQAVSARLGVAWEGAKMLRHGAGDELLAKKDAVDAAGADAEAIRQAQAARAAFDESATSLRAAQAKAESIGASERLAHLAEEAEKRAKAYQEVLDLLQAPFIAPELSASEWDAVRLAQVRRSCEETTEAVVEHISGQATTTTSSRRQRRTSGVCVSL